MYNFNNKMSHRSRQNTSEISFLFQAAKENCWFAYMGRAVVLTLALVVGACGGGGGGGDTVDPLADTDADGMLDVWESDYGFDPDDALDAALDADADGLTNLEEHDLKTHPLLADSDGDGMHDKWEIDYSLDPLSAIDRDSDGDSDQFSNYKEFRLGSDPTDMESVPVFLGLYVEDFEQPLDAQDPQYSFPLHWYWPTNSSTGWARNNLSPATSGQFTLRAGAAADSQESSIVMPVYIEESTMSLKYRLSAEAGDGLEVWIDDELVLARRGLAGWATSPVIEVPAGYHEIRFSFARDESGTQYTNTVWIDDLKITPYSLDSDGDGMPDVWESEYSFNANDAADGSLDADSDGLSNTAEFSNGTNPRHHDSDGDNMVDGWEVDNSFDPLDSTDGQLDTDNDGVINYGEWALGSDPRDENSLPVLMDPYVESFEAAASPLPAGGWDLPELWFVPTDSDGGWNRDSIVPYDGLYSIRPTGLRSSEKAVVVLPVFVSESVLRFRRRVSADSGDGLHVYVDGIRVYRQLGLEGWLSGSDVYLLPGFHEIRFVYAKDSAGSQYTDTAWLDAIRIDSENFDADDDEMADSWEFQNGLNPNDSADGLLDADDDGVINKEEFRQRTNPRDADSDNDGLDDSAELAGGTSPIDADTDGDGAPDGGEVDFGFDPLNPTDAGADPDFDGLGNYAEAVAGTDPNNRDSDGDQIPDGWEVAFGSNPLNAGDRESDTDNDGFTTYQEYRLGSDPSDPYSFPEVLNTYSQSFESPTVPVYWNPSASATNEPWSVSCGLAIDGLCSLQADSSASSGVVFMARFPAGDLSVGINANTPNNFSIKVDGATVYSTTGSTDGWVTEVISLSAGVHEVEFLHAAGDGSGGNVYIDQVAFATSEIGLLARPVNLSCIAPPTSAANVSIEFEYPYPDAVFDFPVAAVQAPGNDGRWYVLEKMGLLKIFDVSNPGDVRTWLDFTGDIRTDGEMGLLSLEFDPQFPTVPEVYVTYVSSSPDSDLRLVRIILDDVDNPVNVQEQLIMNIDQATAYHMGGDMAFGSDGMLWFGIGDDNKSGGAQSTSSLYGAMARIDVLGVPWPVPGYEIPAGNAFAPPAEQPDYHCSEYSTNPYDCPEIYAWGFRNPWRWNFDDDTGQLWLGDVGNNDWEEVNLIELGKNYGWSCYEGDGHPGLLPVEQCLGPFQAPVIEYAHDPFGNTAVIGGFVYRGDEIDVLKGLYIYGDLGSGRIWAMRPKAGGGYEGDELWIGSQVITSFAEGPGDEIYFTNYAPGRIGKLVPKEDDGGPVYEIPDNLADTGCVDPADPTQPAAGLVRYDVAAKLWSDGAEKNRAMAIPEGTRVSINGEDDFVYPIGSVLYKDFYLNGKIIETRLFMHRADGDSGESVWDGFSYEWDAGQEVATLVEGGKVADIDGQQWTFPSGGQCKECHTSAAGHVLGPETAQLNYSIQYPETGNTANQMATLDAISYLQSPLPDVSTLPSLPDPYDESADLGERARGYLHSNCSQCHRPGTTNPTPMDFRYQTLLENTNTCNADPGLGDLGIGPGAKLIAPGDAASSVIVARMSIRDGDQMPPLATAIADADGIALISSWINGLSGCVQ